MQILDPESLAVVAGGSPLEYGIGDPVPPPWQAAYSPEDLLAMMRQLDSGIRFKAN